MPATLLRSLVPASLVCLALCTAMGASAQSVEPFVDHWEQEDHQAQRRLMVNGREWGEWKFYDREGRLIEEAEFKSGQRDGRVTASTIPVAPCSTMATSAAGWRTACAPLLPRRHRDGTWPLCQRAQDRRMAVLVSRLQPMLVERWQDTLVIVNEAWDRDGTHTRKRGTHPRTYYASGSPPGGEHQCHGRAPTAPTRNCILPAIPRPGPVPQRGEGRGVGVLDHPAENRKSGKPS
jgi:hypothetical protein